MKYIILTTVMMLTSTLVINSHAEVARRSAGDSGALAKAEMMMRQMAEENSSMKAENEELKKQLESIKDKVASMKADKTRLSKSLNTTKVIIGKYKENTQALRDRIFKDRDRMKELIGKFKELVAAFKVVEQDKAQLKVNLADNKKEMLNCAENNMKLVKTNQQLVKQYMDKNVWDAMKQSEPITELGKIQVEKIAQEYRQTIDMLKISINDKANN